MTDNQVFYQELGRRIRDARKKGRLTQEALATKVSLTRTTVTNIEKGRQQLLVHTLVDIADALNVAPEALLPESQSPSIDKLLTVETPDAQDWIRRIVDMADRD
ncbi:helix-turn-helix transcriptional regulator [Oscillatoria laete-virens NRMC-F 0139]|nr:helix-turn-helix transcriptional regulator [Oscillatoria laete-virens]MDI9636215.1 helix-turn-helix transcriptional regulator [Geitlerinema splendidum]MDL5053441.1 helix-turn-helix transcriptional regulator [Oscillatoria laete-virens NRMC-F 0139]